MPRELALRGGRPERENIDSRIGSPRRRIARNRERHGPGGGVPRLRPGNTSALEIGDDGVGDILIDVGAIVLGHGGGLHDGGRETLSLLHSVAAPLPRSNSQVATGQTASVPWQTVAARARDRHRRPRRRRRLGERRLTASRARTDARPDAPKYPAPSRRPQLC